jgi:hypothetical protein
LVTRIENATEHKDIDLGSFLDIERAFDRTSLDTKNRLLKGMVLSPLYADGPVLCWKAGI